jgi:hypothetical protein
VALSKENRLQALDNAFLFVLGLTSLVFAALQAAVGGVKSFAIFAPLLIPGLVWPFYCGYVKGAIEGTAPEIDRLRGWMYFFSGTLTYTFATGLVLIATKIPASPNGTFWAFLLEVAFLVVIPFTLSQVSYERLIKWASRVFSYQFKEGEMISLACAILGGWSLAWTSLLLFFFLYIIHDTARIVGPSIFVLTMLTCFVVFERTSRSVLVNLRFHQVAHTGEINSGYYLGEALRLTIRRCLLANHFALTLLVAGWCVIVMIVLFAAFLGAIGSLIADILVFFAIILYARKSIAFLTS